MADSKPEKRIHLWSCGNNIDSIGDAILEIKNDKIIIKILGGTWGFYEARVEVTKDKVKAKDMDNREYEANW